MDNPESTATIKLGGGHEAPWLVVKGNPAAIRRQLQEAFGIESNAEVSLIELIAKLSVDAAAAYSLATGGATPSTGGRRASYSGNAKPRAAQHPPQVESPDDESGSEEDRNISRILAAIEAAQTPQELKMTWAKDQAAFSDTRLQVAYRNKNSRLKDGK